MIEELDIEDKITRRLTTYGSDWRTDLQNRTGSTQVPCLFINGKPMFESLDIIDWMQQSSLMQRELNYPLFLTFTLTFHSRQLRSVPSNRSQIPNAVP